MPCIWQDEWSVLYFEILKPAEADTGERYILQLNQLAEKNREKETLYWAQALTNDITTRQRQDTVILWLSKP